MNGCSQTKECRHHLIIILIYLTYNMSRLYDSLTVTDRLDKKCQLKTRFQKVLIKEL